MSINFPSKTSPKQNIVQRRQLNSKKAELPITPPPLYITEKDRKAPDLSAWNYSARNIKTMREAFMFRLINLLKLDTVQGPAFHPSQTLKSIANKITPRRVITLPLKKIESNDSTFSFFSNNNKMSFSSQSNDTSTENVISTSPTTELFPLSPIKRQTNSTGEKLESSNVKIVSTPVYIPLPKRKESVNWDINKIQSEHKQPTEQIKRYLESMDNHTPFTLNHELRGLYDAALTKAIKQDISTIGEKHSTLSTQVIHYLDRIKDFSLPPSGRLLYTTAAAKAAQDKSCMHLRTEAYLLHAQALIDNQQKQAALPYLTKAKNYLGSSDFHITKEDIEKKIDTLRAEVRAKTF